MSETPSAKPADEKAWRALAACDPVDVCRRASATYDSQTGAYRLPVFGQSIRVFPRERRLTAQSPLGEQLLTRQAYFSTLVIRAYLAQARAMPPSGRWITPADLRQGDIYYRGSHVLPLPGLAARYDRKRDAFLEQGQALGGAPADYGDTAIILPALPRWPLLLILRESDDEFPASAEFLFDSTCEQHGPADILWSLAMLSVLMMFG